MIGANDCRIAKRSWHWNVLSLALALGLLALLAACGFQPLYADRGEHRDVHAGFTNLAIDTIPDRSGQILQGFLRDRLTPRGEPAQVVYRLRVENLTEQSSALALATDGTTLLYNLQMRGIMVLVKNGTALTRQSISVQALYNAAADQYSTESAKAAARERALRDMADRIQLRLAAYIANGT